MSLQTFFQEFIQAIANFASQGVLTKEVLQDYSKAKLALHGILESALVQAGWRIGWLPVVEPRVDLSLPFVPSSYNPNLLEKRKRHLFRPALGYYRNNKLEVFAECCTTDEAYEYNPSNQTIIYDPEGRGWITKREILHHFVQHAKPKLSELIICVALPHKMKKKPPWRQYKGIGNNFYGQFKQGWDGLVQTLQKYTPTHLIVLEEKGVNINNIHYPINIH